MTEWIYIIDYTIPRPFGKPVFGMMSKEDFNERRKHEMKKAKTTAKKKSVKKTIKKKTSKK